MNNFFSEKVLKAVELASIWHNGQWRKDLTEKIPYISHPVAVGILLLNTGFDDEVVAAGILHDVVEDCEVTKQEIVLWMGERVANMVMDVTEKNGLTWKERKAEYRSRLESVPLESLAISAADHLHNLYCLKQALARDVNAWNIFSAKRDDKIFHEKETLAIIKRSLISPLVEKYEEILLSIEAGS